MRTHRDFQDVMFHPKVFLKLAFRFGQEVAHAIPIPDQLGWLLSLPLVSFPLAVFAGAYAVGYYVSMGAFWTVELIGVGIERFWDGYGRKYWLVYIPEQKQAWFEEVVPETRFEERRKEQLKQRKEKKLEERLEKRGEGQKNITKDSENGRSFKNE